MNTVWAYCRFGDRSKRGEESVPPRRSAGSIDGCASSALCDRPPDRTVGVGAGSDLRRDERRAGSFYPRRKHRRLASGDPAGGWSRMAYQHDPDYLRRHRSDLAARWNSNQPNGCGSSSENAWSIAPFVIWTSWKPCCWSGARSCVPIQRSIRRSTCSTGVPRYPPWLSPTNQTDV